MFFPRNFFQRIMAVGSISQVKITAFKSKVLQINFVQSHKRSKSNSYPKHSHKKWKDSLEAWTVLSIILLELEIYEVETIRIHQNSEKW